MSLQIFAIAIKCNTLYNTFLLHFIHQFRENEDKKKVYERNWQTSKRKRKNELFENVI